MNINFNSYLGYINSCSRYIDKEDKERFIKADEVLKNIFGEEKFQYAFQNRFPAVYELGLFDIDPRNSLYLYEVTLNIKNLYDKCIINKNVDKIRCKELARLIESKEYEHVLGARAELLFGGYLVNRNIETEIIKTPDFRFKISDRWIYAEVTALSESYLARKVEEFRNELEDYIGNILKNIECQQKVFLTINLGYEEVEKIKEPLKDKLREIISKNIQIDNDTLFEGISLKTISVDKWCGFPPIIYGPPYSWNDIQRITGKKFSDKANNQLRSLNSPTIIVIFTNSIDNKWYEYVEQLIKKKMDDFPFISGVYLWLETFASKKGKIISNSNPNALYPLMGEEIADLKEPIN